MWAIPTPIRNFSFSTSGRQVLRKATNTQDATPSPGFSVTFQSNPSLSSDGSVVSFISSANLAGNNADVNAEILSGELQRFRGEQCAPGYAHDQRHTNNTNVLTPGRRLSRNGAFIAFESRATDPKANTAPTSADSRDLCLHSRNGYVCRDRSAPDVFTDISTSRRLPITTRRLTPSSLIFASALNFRPDGTFPPEAQDSEGLNRNGQRSCF